MLPGRYRCSSSGRKVTVPARWAHYNTFLALETADPAFATLSAYFDGCRMKRNSCEYDFAGGVTDTDAEGLLKEVRQFAVDAEAWIKARYPQLA
jgi:hypothetical protein